MRAIAAAERLEASVDDELVRRAALGDAGAFDVLISARLDRCYRLAYSIVGNEARRGRRDAGSGRRPPGASCRALRDRSSFDSWLNRIVANAARMSRRHRVRLRESGDRRAHGECVTSWRPSRPGTPEAGSRRRVGRRASAARSTGSGNWTACPRAAQSKDDWSRRSPARWDAVGTVKRRLHQRGTPSNGRWRPRHDAATADQRPARGGPAGPSPVADVRMHERVLAEISTTPQERRLPSLLGRLTDADPMARRRMMLLVALVALCPCGLGHGDGRARRHARAATAGTVARPAADVDHSVEVVERRPDREKSASVSTAGRKPRSS